MAIRTVDLNVKEYKVNSSQDGIGTGVIFLGPDISQTYSTSIASDLLNRNVNSDDVITVTILKGSTDDSKSKVPCDTVISLINKNPFTDQWLRFHSNYTRPLNGSDSSSFGTSTINSLTSIAGRFNTITKAMGGFGMQNKLKDIPVWGNTEVLTFTVYGMLMAFSDPSVEVHQPLAILINMALANGVTGNNFIVDVPGPTFNENVWNQLSDSAGATSQGVQDTAQTIDPVSLFSGGNQIYVKLGGLAEIGPVIITDVIPITPPNHTEVTSLTTGNKFFPWAEVAVTFQTYFAPQSMYTVSGDMTDLDSVKLFRMNDYV